MLLPSLLVCLLVLPRGFLAQAGRGTSYTTVGSAEYPARRNYFYVGGTYEDVVQVSVVVFGFKS